MDEIRLLRDGSATLERYVPLRRNKLREGDKDLPEQINCAPSRSVAVLPKINAVVLGLDKYELSAMDYTPEDKVAVVNMEERQLRVVDVGRGGVKFGNFMAGLGMSMGMAMGTGMAFYSSGLPIGVHSVPGGTSIRYGSGRVLPAADGVSAYVLNAGTRDVTVIDAAAGKQGAVLPVGRGCAYMFRSPNGDAICVVCQGHLAVLDSRKHQLQSKYDVTSGKVVDAFVDPSTGHLLVLTSQSLIDFDMEKAVVAGVVTGLDSPRLVLTVN
jgi:DNA-binding beta-propeller fold protein YncE